MGLNKHDCNPLNTLLLTYTSQIKKLSFKRDPSPGRWSRVFPIDFKTKQIVSRVVFYQSHHILCAAINHTSFWIHQSFHNLLQKVLLQKQHEVSSRKSKTRWVKKQLPLKMKKKIGQGHSSKAWQTLPSNSWFSNLQYVISKISTTLCNTAAACPLQGVLC